MANAAKSILTAYDASNSVKQIISKNKLNKYIADEELTDQELDDTTGVPNFRQKAKAIGILEKLLRNYKRDTI